MSDEHHDSHTNEPQPPHPYDPPAGSAGDPADPADMPPPGAWRTADLPDAAPAQAPAGTPPPRGSRRRTALIVAAFALVILAGAAATALIVARGDGHPDEWDERVLDLVDFVEDERDLDFEHPVHVEFLTADEYSEKTTTDEDELTDEDRKELERYAGAFRALGLIEGEVDLFEEGNELADAGTLAYYDFEGDRIVVRGTELTPGLRLTLVHELTHALQDQHFSIDEIDELETDGEALALRALIEGDATRVEDAYYETLDADEQAEVDEAESEEEAPELDVPDALATLFGAPYFLGDGFVAVLLADDGEEAVDRAFGDPPTTEEQLLDPFAYLDDDEALTVATPEPPDGAEVVDDGDFGALTWFLALSERLEPMQALRAVDGWGGDSFVLYEDGSRTCVAAAFVGDTDEDTSEMSEALGQWAAKMPAGAASVAQEGEATVLRSCDPGADAELEVTGASSEAIELPLMRTGLAAGVMQQGATAEQARCFGHELIGAFPVEQLLDESEVTPEVQQQVLAIVERCR